MTPLYAVSLLQDRPALSMSAQSQITNDRSGRSTMKPPTTTFTNNIPQSKVETFFSKISQYQNQTMSVGGYDIVVPLNSER